MAKKKYLEYEDMTVEQRDQKRLEMLAELERRMREHDGGKPPRPEEADHVLNKPMYFDGDVLHDPGYQGLSVVGKLSWYSLAIAASTTYHMEQPLDVSFLIVYSGLATKFGQVLIGKDLQQGLDELLETDLVDIEVMQDRVEEYGKDESGEYVVTDYREVEREIITFNKYVAFEQPAEYAEA